ncbi:hypothetical protein B0H16DRAFT_1474319 [Mycena metata]|uniref:Uncharacterized protein n=1 Tax=Mycena metata TaxID=1033252 RepID=A0AAD7HH43_9AGAR|nr:hypothetical protein B0H16DRAFT_1474319 [Mycena metata]
MYLQAKGNKKGNKKGRKNGALSGGFTVALFLALFGLVPLLYLVSFIATKGKKPGGKRKKWEKGRKKGVKKGGKRATVNDPSISSIPPNNLDFQRRVIQVELSSLRRTTIGGRWSASVQLNYFAAALRHSSKLDGAGDSGGRTGAGEHRARS